MRYLIFHIVLISFFLGFSRSGFSQIKGKITDEQKVEIPGVRVFNSTQNFNASSDLDGKFYIKANIGDTLRFTLYGFDTVILKLENNDFLKIELPTFITEVAETNVIRSNLEGFNVGFLPTIRGVEIFTGTNAVIELSNLNGAKSTGNAREIFGKIPGLNIWESDGSGIQIGIGGRGLSPNRTANFNTRQNGYDISADALGYPESYYVPPYEALHAIEIVRGSASLQYGTQFGGLLNFVIREPAKNKFEFTTRNTVGSYGYFGIFNRITGSVKRWEYQIYHQYKSGNGYRKNSSFNQQQLFAQVVYNVNEKIRISTEYTHMDYLAQQAGGLSDAEFEKDPRQSNRDRNWFQINWNILAVRANYNINNKTTFNARVFGMLSYRSSLGFLGKITQADPGGTRDMIDGEFANYGAEIRILRRYTSKKSDFKGAILGGARYYKGSTTANQGKATDGTNADFRFKNVDNLENSAYSFPSENLAFFVENISYITKKWTVNTGFRFENIQSSAKGYFKQYAVHPVNMDTLAVYKIESEKITKRNVPLFGFGSSYKLGTRNSLYVNFTQNYRAINFTDIRVVNPNIVVDSNIQDEHGYTAELGYRGLKKSYWIYDMALFYVYYGDKIGLAPKVGTTKKERTNIGDAQNYGLELFTEFDILKALNDSTLHGLSVFTNISWINANYIRSKESNYIGKQVEYVSQYILRGGIKYKYDNFAIQIMASYNSQQFSDASNAVEPSGDAVIGLVPSYYVVDFSANWSFKKQWKLELGITNLTNNSYFTRRASAYPGPGILPADGRTIYGTLQWQFGR